jgi:uncharacterized protein (TIGR03437 family)
MMLIRISLLFLACAAIWAQPTPPEVYLNHAGHRYSALAPGGALAPGSLAEISVFLNNPISQPILEKIQYKAPGATDFVELNPISPLGSFQATVRIPLDSPTGEAEIQLQLAGGTEKRLKFPIQASNFGWFTRSNEPNGAAIAQTSGREVKLTQPARPGDVLTLWGTGLGRAQLSNIHVEIGGKWAIPTYAGPAPGYPGLDQINVAIPAEVASDCYIPLLLFVRELWGPPASIPVKGHGDQPSSQGCRHRLGLQPDQLAALDNGESIPIAQTWAYGVLMPDAESPELYRRYDAASIHFFDRSAASVQSLTGLFQPPKNGCWIITPPPVGGFILTRPSDLGHTELLGPSGFRQTMEGLALKNYTFPNGGPYPLQDVPPFAMASGSWRILVAGGSQLHPLDTPLRLPPPLRWLNRDTARSHSLKEAMILRWAPEGYNQDERITATLQTQPPVMGMTMFCEAPAQAGSLSVQAEFLQLLTSSLPANISLSLRLSPDTMRPRISVAPSLEGKTIPIVSTFTYSETIQGSLH